MSNKSTENKKLWIIISAAVVVVAIVAALIIVPPIVKDSDYNRAIELIETGELENKKEAYKLLSKMHDYKDTNSIIYYLWAEDIYDPKDDVSFEQANQFMMSIPEAYDGPFKEEIAKLRSQVNKSYSELMQKKFEAATSTDFTSEEVIAE